MGGRGGKGEQWGVGGRGVLMVGVGVWGGGGGRSVGGRGGEGEGWGGRIGGWAVVRTREGLNAEVNLEITTTAGRLSINKT